MRLRQSYAVAPGTLLSRPYGPLAFVVVWCFVVCSAWLSGCTRVVSAGVIRANREVLQKANPSGNETGLSVGTLSDQSVQEDGSLQDLPLTVDGEVRGSLACNTALVATSSNEALVKSANIAVAGILPNCTLSLGPEPNQHGRAAVAIAIAGTANVQPTSFELTVDPVNDTPVVSAPGASQMSVAQEEPALVAVATAADPDIDTDGQSLRYVVVSAPLHGVLGEWPPSAAMGGTVSYTPSDGFVGSDSFQYQMCDDGEPSACSETVVVDISVSNVNEAPTDISLSNSSLAENAGPNALVGTLNTVDPDFGDTFVYTLVAGDGDTDNFAFSVSSNELRLNASADYEAKERYSLRIQVQDQGGAGLTFQKALTIEVTNVNEAPSLSDVSDQSTDEDSVLSNIDVTIADPDGALVCSTALSAQSASTTLLPSGSVTVGGSYPDCTLSLAPAANEHGVATVTLTVSDGGGGSATDTLVLTVNPVNDAPSIAAAGDLTRVTAQDTVTLVNLATGSDPDVASGGQSLTYLVSTPPSHGRLGAIPASATAPGSVSYTPDAGFVGADSFVYQICDSFSPPSCTTAGTVNLTVIDINDPPTDMVLVPGSLAENAGPSALAGTLTATDPDSGDTFTYAFVEGDGDTDNAAFSLIGDKLYLKASADYEAKASYSVRVQCTDLGQASLEKVFTIAVTDENEAPTDITLSEATVAENTEANVTIGTVSSTDPDLGDSASYTLVPGADADAFVLTGSTLILSTPADYESKASYAITLRVTDSKGSTFEKTLTIGVTNENEAPSDLSLSSTSVSENAGSNAPVGALSSVDPDAGDTFVYTLVSGEGDADNGSFSISGNELRLNSSANFESKSSYAVRVRSTDSGGLWFEKAFTVGVVGVNEAPTNISLSNSTVAENAGSDALVGTLSSSDPDGDTAFSYTLVSGDGDADNDAFNISSNSLRLSANADFETKASYSVRIRSTDAGGMWFEQAFAVNVVGVNENPTDLTLAPSSIAENAGTDAVVGGFFTSDPDAETNFLYSLVTGTGDADNDDFNISNNSLRLTSSANFELKSSYSVRVRSTDAGGLWVEKVFTVTVTGINEAPTDLSLSNSSVAENAGSDALVGNLSSTDLDGDTGFSYTLVAGNGDTDNAAFNISGNSLRLTSSANFETQSTYLIRIRSTDAGGLWFEKSFSVTVTDVNEAPTNVSLSSTSVAENAGLNATVGTLSTADPDSGDSHTYTFVDGAGDTDNGEFSISGSELRLNSNADFEAKPSYSVRIRSQDQNGAGLSFEKSMTITVANVNEAPTSLVLSSTSLDENAGSDVLVGTLSSTDPDASDSFVYTLVSGMGDNDNAAFTISGSSLRLISSADFETKSNYSVRIETRDQNGAGLTYSTNVTITITNVNEAPTIEDVANQSTSEDVALTGLTVTIADVDGPLVCSSALSGVSSDVSLLSNTSIVSAGSYPSCSVSLIPAANQNGTTTVTLTVSDGSLSAIDTFVLTVQAANDAPTVVTTGTTTLSVEYQTAGSVELATATDVDSATNAQTLSYSVTVSPSNGSLGSFPASAVSGGTLTYTPGNGFFGSDSFSYRICDSGSPSLCTESTTVLVTVLGHRWRSEAYIKAANAEGGDQFGYALSLSGDTLAVGALYEDENSTIIVNGTTAPNSNGTADSGAVYVYRRSGVTWTPEAYIKAPSVSSGDLFGSAVSLSGETLAVGAYGEDENSTVIVNGTSAPNTNGALDSGAVYIYRRTGSTWALEAYIKAANAAGSDNFGKSVSLSGDSLAVGAYYEDENSSVIVNGTTAPNVNGASNAGAVYVYRRTGLAWTPEAYIKPANVAMDDQFGLPVSLSGDTLAVGAQREDENSTVIVNGITAPNVNGALSSGAVYIYRRTGAMWGPEAYIKAANVEAGDLLGSAVSLSGDTLAVGAYGEDENSSAIVNGTTAPNGNGAADSGAVYVFRRTGTAWAREAYVKAANVAFADAFGWSVAVSGDTLAVGAPYEDENSSVIVNGATAPNSNGATDSGAVYVYRRTGSAWAPEAYIKAANAAGLDYFGFPVALSGDTLAVAAYAEDENSTLIVNGLSAPNLNGAVNSGAVYVYRHKRRVFEPDIVVSALTDTSVTFSWSADTLGSGTSVLVAPYVVGTGSPVSNCADGGTLALGSGVNSHTISGLTASTKYGVRFCSTNGSETSAGATLWINTREANVAPVLGAIATQENVRDESFRPVALTVSDANGFLICSSALSASSGNNNLIPNTGITFSGNWPACIMNLSPVAGQIGESSVTVTLTDGALSDQKTFAIKVTEGWQREAYLKAANAAAGDNFGFALILSGDTLAVSASAEDENSRVIVSGTTAPNNNGAADSGAVYIYRRSGSLWAQEAYTKAANAAASDTFGFAVSLSGDTLAVGAYSEDENSSVIVNGTTAPDSNGATDSGAVYVYRRTGVSWAPEAYLKAANAEASDRFGSALSVSGDTLAVGVAAEDENSANIVNGSTAPNSNGATNSGAVYVYRRTGSAWTPEAYIKAANASAADNFGSDVTLSGDTLAVGANGEDENSTTIVNGTTAPNSDGASSSGAVYVYRRTATAWSQEAYIKAANAEANQLFGSDISLSGDTLAVGSWFEDENSTMIVNGLTAPTLNGAGGSGAVYVYRRSGTAWAPEAYIKAANAEAWNYFGQSVSLSGDTLAVGAYAEDENSTAIVNGSTAPNLNGAAVSGAVYVYRRSGTVWAPEAYIKAANAEGNDSFGRPVSLSGDSLAVGASNEDENSTTIVNGTTAPNSNGANDSGAVYVYRNKVRVFDPDVVVSALSDTSITLAWKPDSLGSASSILVAPYVVGTGSPAAGCTDGGAVTLGGGVNSHTFSGLTASTKYGFRVCSTTGAETSSGTTLWVNTREPNAAPVLGALANVERFWSDTPSPVALSVSDPNGYLICSVALSASSSNTTLIPDTNITFSGNWPACTMSLDPVAGQNGFSSITVTLSDGSLSHAQTFDLRVREGWRREAYIKAANAEGGDQFGYALSLSGDTLAVGALYEDENSTVIVNGLTAPNLNGAVGSGAVYIYRRTGVSWTPEAYIKAANAEAGDGFGGSVSLSGDTLAVGASGEDENSRLIVNGTTAPNSNGSDGAGAVYVYRRSGTAWAPEAYIKAINAATYHGFGNAVSIWGNTLAVAASNESENGTVVVNGSTATNYNWAQSAGSVYLYRRTGSLWAPEAYVKAANTAAYDRFGGAVSVSDDTLVVGTGEEDENTTVIVNGTTAPNNNGADTSGAAYVYRRTGSTWAPEAYVKAANTGASNYFGTSVSVAGDTLAVGAYGEDENSRIIVNGTTAPNAGGAGSSGAVYIYRRSGTTWAREAYIKAANAELGDYFGVSVSLSGDTLVAGAMYDDENSTVIVNGTSAPNVNGASQSGAVYVYRRTGSTWAADAYFKAANVAADDYFGGNVSVSGDTVAVGAFGEDENSSVIANGTSAPNSNGALNSGAVYIYRNKSRVFDPDVVMSAVSDTSVTFTWSASSLGSASSVLVAPYVVGTGSPAASCSDVASVTLNSGVSSHTVSGLAASTKYGFRFCSTDGSETSQGSALWINTRETSAAPLLGTIASQEGHNQGLVVALSVSDPNGFLICSAALSAASDNPPLIPNSSITFEGSWPACTMNLSPTAGQVGQANVTVSLSDGTLSDQKTFALKITEGWRREAYLKAANAQTNDYFGKPSISGDTLAVSAYGEDENSRVIVNGTTAPNSDGATDSGAVYVYRRTGGAWAREAYIKAANAAASDTFGYAVSLSGDTLAVGAHLEDENSSFIVNGTTAPDSNGATDSGAVYVYRRTGVSWAPEAYLKAANAEGYDYFGSSLSLSGDTLAVGAHEEDENSANIVNGTTAPNSNGATNSGAVYVYRRTGSAWAPEAYIKAANAEAADRFGQSVSLFGDTLAVGALYEDENSSVIVNGTSAPNTNGALDSGAVYIYRRTGTAWAPEAYIKAANAEASDNFGNHVSLWGDTLAVGAINEGENSTIIVSGTTAPNSNGATHSGAVYVYRRTGSLWTREAYIKAANVETWDYLGVVSLSGDTLAVGAYNEAENSTVIVNGTTAPNSNGAGMSGAVYVYRRTGSVWAREAYIKAANAEESDSFGGSVSLSGDTLAVGAAGEDENSTVIINGFTAPNRNGANSSGALYIYRNKFRVFDPDVVISALSDTSVTFSWNTDALGSAGSVLVAPYVVGTGSPAASCTDGGTVTLGSGVNSYTFSDLTASTKYGFRFCSTNGSATSPGSTLWVNTREPSAPPVLGAIANQNLGMVYAPTTVALSVSDPNGFLVCSTALSAVSSNAALIPSSNITFSGIWPSCTMSLTPLAGVLDPATITVTLSDGTLSDQKSFELRAVDGWRREAYIKAANAQAYDFFGKSVSLSGDTLAVGAYKEDENSSVIVNGTTAPNSNGASDSGAAYVYRRTGASWAPEAYIKAANVGGSDYFGWSVSLSGDALAVGAYSEDENSTVIVNGTTAPNLNAATGAGAAYVYRRTGSVWEREAYIKAANAAAGDSFGFSVSLVGDTLAVGADGEDENSTVIVNGSTAPNSNGADGSGAVYVYRRTGSIWAPEAYIKAANAAAADGFGNVVSLSGDTLAVVASLEDENSTVIVNGTTAPNLNGAEVSGAVYVYRRTGVVWQPEAYIKAANTQMWDMFGSSLSLSGDTLAVGATGEDENSTVIANGTTAPNSNGADASGAVYVYRRTGVLWAPEAYIKAANNRASGSFGSSVSLSGDTLGVGARYEQGNTGAIVNGTTASNSFGTGQVGALYVYRRTGSTWAPEAYIKAFNPDAADYFASSISLSGDTIAAGASDEGENSTTIMNGTTAPNNNGATQSGAVYVYRNATRLFDPDVRVSSRTQTSITFAWSSSHGTATSVVVAPAGAGTANPGLCSDAGAVTLGAGTQTYTYSGLSAGTKYGFRFCASDGVTLSPGNLIWFDTSP